MNIEITDLDMILNYLETTNLEPHDDYTSEITYKDQKILYKYIKELQQENQHLKIQISAREEECKKLENNWNELKRWLYEDNYLYIDMVRDNSTYTKIFKKMQELERGVSDDSN